MPFQFSHGTDGKLQYARLSVPGTARKERDDAPVILVEIENGHITLFVYADCKSSEATHEISLDGAKIERKHE